MNPDDQHRLPPSDRTAEVCVLGAMILDASTIDDAGLLLRAQDFYTPAHGQIFGLLLDLHAADKPVDLVLVKQAAEAAGILDRIGGVDYLMELVDGVPSVANLPYYAGIVRDLATKRAMLTHAMTLQAAAYNPAVGAAALLATAEAGLGAISTGRTADALTTATDAAEAVLRDLEAVQRGEASAGLMTGLEAIDTACGGLRPGELVVIAGATGSGKSTLADTIAVRVADAGGRVHIASVEMLADERAQRLLQIIGQIDGSRMRQPHRLTVDDWTALQEATAELERMRITLHTGEMTTGQITANAKRAAKRMGGLDLVIVDYLQLITPTREQGANRREQIGAMAWSMKMQLGVGLKVPVMLVSQFRRQSDEKELWPRRSWLKESGDIENHSNVIWLLYRPEPGGKHAAHCAPDEVLLCQDKHRSMPLTPWTGDGSIKLKWSRRTTTFTHAYRAEHAHA
jgi:replicative DNA helicase